MGSGAICSPFVMKKTYHIPHFLEANSKQELMQKMLTLQVVTHQIYTFFDIQKDGSKWVAWYLDSAEITLKDKLNSFGKKDKE